MLGSLNVDLSVIVPRLPGPGETVIGGVLRSSAGGKGANQAVAAARLGGKVAMIGRVGIDEFGAFLRSSLADEGVDITLVASDPASPTGTALIVVDSGGENQIAVAPGANATVGDVEVDGALKNLDRHDTVLIQLEVPFEPVCKLVDGARIRGARTVLNAAPARTLPDSLLSAVDILVVNEHEAAVVSGLDVSNTKQAATAGAKLVAAGTRTVIVTLGPMGAVLCQSDGSRHLPVRSIQAVDSTGAGDAFTAALAVWVTSGIRIDRAVALANMAGAVAASRRGSQSSLPYLRDIPGL